MGISKSAWLGGLTHHRIHCFPTRVERLASRPPLLHNAVEGHVTTLVPDKKKSTKSKPCDLQLMADIYGALLSFRTQVLCYWCYNFPCALLSIRSQVPCSTCCSAFCVKKNNISHHRHHARLSHNLSRLIPRCLRHNLSGMSRSA